MEEVISLTKDKVWTMQINQKTVYCKKTTYNEVENLKKARKFLLGKSVFVNKKEYKINIPQIYFWNSNKSCIYMQECTGDNLELILRNLKERVRGINILHGLMEYLLSQKFYWKDFAPRNILVDDKTISLVDFERELIINEKLDIKWYLRENVYEEYVAFLLPKERPILPEQIFKLQNESNRLMNIKDIKSNRVKKIANRLNLSETICSNKYLQIIKMLVDAEEPKEDSNGNIIFPIIQLEQIMSDYGYDKYIEEILKRNNIEIEMEK